MLKKHAALENQVTLSNNNYLQNHTNIRNIFDSLRTNAYDVKAAVTKVNDLDELLKLKAIQTEERIQRNIDALNPRFSNLEIMCEKNKSSFLECL